MVLGWEAGDLRQVRNETAWERWPREQRRRMRRDTSSMLTQSQRLDDKST